MATQSAQITSLLEQVIELNKQNTIRRRTNEGASQPRVPIANDRGCPATEGENENKTKNYYNAYPCHREGVLDIAYLASCGGHVIGHGQTQMQALTGKVPVIG